MKLVIVMPFPERVGGAENTLYTFLEHLDRRLIDVVLVFLGSGDLEEDVAALGFPTHVIPTARLRHGAKLGPTVRRLRQIFEVERPELILNWGTKAHVLGWPAASLSGFGDRLVWCQLAVPTRRMDSTKLATLLPALGVICSSHIAARAQESSWPRRATFVIHRGIDPPRSAPAEELAALRTSLEIPAGRTVVGTVGRLQKLKRQTELIRSFSRLHAEGHDIHGLIVGGDAYNLDPDYERSLHQLVDDLGLSDRVVFAGQVPDPDPYLQLMDIFVMSSPHEGFGRALIEAMANGVVSVGVGTSGPAEIIEHERSGLLVDRADAGLFAEAIVRLLTDDSLRERLAEAGRQRQHEHFSASRMTEKFEHYLLEIAPEIPHR